MSNLPLTLINKRRASLQGLVLSFSLGHYWVAFLPVEVCGKSDKFACDREELLTNNSSLTNYRRQGKTVQNKFYILVFFKCNQILRI